MYALNSEESEQFWLLRFEEQMLLKNNLEVVLGDVLWAC